MSIPQVTATAVHVGNPLTIPGSVIAGDLLMAYVTVDGTIIVTATAPGWTLLSPTNLNRPAAALYNGTTSFPGVILYRLADGTEAGTSVTFTVNSATAISAAIALDVVRGSAGVPVLHDNAGYPWYNNTSGVHSVTDVPGIAAGANNLQLMGINGQIGGDDTHVPTLTGGWVLDCNVNRWYPSSGWAHHGFGAVTPGGAPSVVTEPLNGYPDPDPYCRVVTIAELPASGSSGGLSAILRAGSGVYLGSG